jgi:hypothetical protein
LKFPSFSNGSNIIIKGNVSFSINGDFSSQFWKNKIKLAQEFLESTVGKKIKKSWNSQFF